MFELTTARPALPTSPAAAYHALMFNSLLPHHAELPDLVKSGANLSLLNDMYPFDPMAVFAYIATTVGNMSDAGIDLAQEDLMRYSQEHPIENFMRWYSGNNETSFTDGMMDCWHAMFAADEAPQPRRDLISTGQGYYQEAWNTLYEVLVAFFAVYPGEPGWEDEYPLDRAGIDRLMNIIWEVLAHD